MNPKHMVLTLLAAIATAVTAEQTVDPDRVVCVVSSIHVHALCSRI